MNARSRPAELGQGLALLIVGALGALVGQAIGIPAGIIVGALLASGIYRLACGERLATGQLDPWRKRYGRVGRLLLGTVIGAAFGPDVIEPFKAALLPMAALIVVIVGVGLLLGWTLGRFTKLDLATAIISAVPGGLPAMTAMAEEVEADATVVAAIHFARLTTILVAVPALLRVLLGSLAEPTATVSLGEPVGWGLTVITLALGVLGAFVAVKARIPTGDLVGPLLIVGGVNLLGAGLGPLPTEFRQSAMLFIGISVGVQMSRESLYMLRQVALPAAAMVITLIGAGLLLGWGLSQVTPLDLTSALLSGVPGGASTMPLIAHALGGDIRLVAALHLTRQLVMLVVVPPVLSYLLYGRRRRRAVAPNLPK